MLRSRNATRYTKELNIYINKELQKIAEDSETKVKRALRDMLEGVHKQDIYSTLGPIQSSGKKVQKYNEQHKHRKKQPYHHTNILISSVKGVIKGNVVGIELEDKYYNDGTSVKDVYEWLDKGTNSDYDYYVLGGKGSHTPYVTYVPTPPHRFKRLTLVHMDNFIKNELIPDIEKGKYLKKGG